MGADENNAGKRRAAGGTPEIYNLEAIAKFGKRKTLGGAIFIVFGMDLVNDISDTGKTVIALRDGRNVNRLIAAAEKEAPNCPLVLILQDPKEDSESIEVQAMERLKEGLEEREIFTFGPFDARDYEPEITDAGRVEYIEGLFQKLDAIQKQALTENIEWLDARRNGLEKESVAGAVDAFLETVLKGKTARPVPTGFATLDEKLDGGLYAGLYAIGAISALGKTTLALQIADQIAAAGERDVLIFSLEMDSFELMAKSISRYTYKLDPEHGMNAKTTRGILSGKFAPGDEKRNAEIELVKAAAAEYKKAGAHIHIREGIGNIGVEQIRAQVAKFTRIEGAAPVVLVDYLQILAPYDIRATDKQNTDKAVLELKRISRDFNTPVIAISSFNRDNYTAPVNTASFKESGAIEYSSDVLIGLQYEGMEYQEGESDAARQKRIRELMRDMEKKSETYKTPQKVQVRILKNRNGARGDIAFEEIPMFNYFRDTGRLSETHEPAPTFEWK